MTSPSPSSSSFRPHLDRDDVVAYQLSRRGLLAAGGVAATGLLAACAGGSYTDNGGTKGGGEEVQIAKANIPTPREETVIFVDGADFQIFDNWNNLIPNGAPLGSGFHASCMESLFYLDPVSGETIPWLAEKWEFNEDFTEFTIALNPKAAWSDGEPVTSKDFAYTIGLARDHDDLLRGGGDYKDITDVATPDDHTAVLTLKNPNPRFHYLFVNVLIDAFDMKPAHIWEKQDPAKFMDNPPVRTGPYTLKQAIPDQKMFVWERNPDYWNAENLDPKAKYAIWHTIPPQADAAALLFERAQTDYGSVDAEYAAQLEAKGYPALVTATFLDPCPRGLWVNSAAERGVVGDPKMHWVISHLVDRETIATKVMPVVTEPAQWPWANYESTSKFSFPELAEKYPLTYDPEKAAALLDEIAPKDSGGTRMYDGKKASIEIITTEAVGSPLFNVGELLRKELVDLGVAATYRSVAPAVYDEAGKAGEFDVQVGWSCDFRNDPRDVLKPYPKEAIAPLGKEATEGNNVRLDDEEMEDVVEKLGQLDPAGDEAMELYRQGMERYFERLPFVPVVQTPGTQYFNSTFWKNWPAGDDMYALPFPWWGHFLFGLGGIESTGQKAPE